LTENVKETEPDFEDSSEKKRHPINTTQIENKKMIKSYYYEKRSKPIKSDGRSYNKLLIFKITGIVDYITKFL